MTFIEMTFLAEAGAAAVSGFWANIDMGTLATAVVTLLLIVGGFYDRRSRSDTESGACTQCLAPVLQRVEGILSAVQQMIIQHNADASTQGAIEAEREKALLKAMDGIMDELREIRREINGGR